jgi:hypothetical protein
MTVERLLFKAYTNINDALLELHKKKDKASTSEKERYDIKIATLRKVEKRLLEAKETMEND